MSAKTVKEAKADDVQTYVGGREDAAQDFDAEKVIGSEGGDEGRKMVIDGNGQINPNEHSVHRVLKQRHMAMISLGGAIGTGLFIGSGAALSTAGPVGTWLGYIFMAIFVYSMMVALGEMAALFPVSGAFTHYAARFVDPSLGFAVGLNYWYSWAVTIPTEIVSAAIIVSYWDDKTNPAVYITVFLVFIWVINLCGTRVWAESEFICASIKVIAIVALIILGIVLMAGGGPNHDPIGFRYWRDPGPFAQITINDGADIIPGRAGQFLAFWSVFLTAAFSFLGTEIIATTVGEAQNPRKTVPKAIKRVFFRLAAFYVLGIFVISVLVPYTEPRLLGGSNDATASPFVIAIQNAGIKGLPSVANAVFLIAALSAGQADCYAASRTLYALALQNQAPRFIRRCTKSGIPLPAIIITALFGPLAYLNTGGEAAVQAFDWLYNIGTTSGVITWWVILLSYLRFYYAAKKQGLNRKAFPYVAPLQPYLSWVGFIFFTLVLIFNGFTIFLKGNWSVSKFFTAYITLPVFAVCWVGWKVFKKTEWVKLEDIDFETGRRELDEEEASDAITYAPEGRLQTMIGWLF